MTLAQLCISVVFKFSYIPGTVISCAGPDRCLTEGETFMVTCSRFLDRRIQSKIEVVSEDGTAEG